MLVLVEMGGIAPPSEQFHSIPLHKLGPLFWDASPDFDSGGVGTDDVPESTLQAMSFHNRSLCETESQDMTIVRGFETGTVRGSAVSSYAIDGAKLGTLNALARAFFALVMTLAVVIR